VIIDQPSLLITDDDRDFREALRAAFEPRGFRTWLARSGEEALEIVGRERVHIALMDMHMPKWTGLETIERMRALGCALPWILMSAALDDLVVAAARRAEVCSVLAKPVRFLELSAAVQHVLHTRYGWNPGRR
jgi:CheY-like chemotaxis protein